MATKPSGDLSRVLWDELQAADQEWTEAAQVPAELQRAPSGDTDELQLLADQAAAANARRDKAGMDRDVKYEMWRLCHLLDQLSHPA